MARNGRECSICIHPKRTLIESEVVAGATIYAAAKHWGVSRDQLRKHLQNAHTVEMVDAVRGYDLAAEDPIEHFRMLVGRDPWPWQVEYLPIDDKNILVLKGRQVGASTGSANKAIRKAKRMPGSTSVIVSPSQKQSEEILNRANLQVRHAAFADPVSVSVRQITLGNGSRIVSLPGTATSIRGYSADLLIIDEAAYVEEDTWTAAEALTAATGGQKIVQSTPAGAYGKFYTSWMAESDGWVRIAVRSDEAGVSEAFLADQRARMTELEYAQEFEASFGTLGSGMFDPERPFRATRPEYPDDPFPSLRQVPGR